MNREFKQNESEPQSLLLIITLESYMIIIKGPTANVFVTVRKHR